MVLGFYSHPGVGFSFLVSVFRVPRGFGKSFFGLLSVLRVVGPSVWSACCAVPVVLPLAGLRLALRVAGVARLLLLASFVLPSGVLFSVLLCVLSRLSGFLGLVFSPWFFGITQHDLKLGF